MQMPDILMTYKLGLMGGRDINQPESEDSYEENKVLDYDFSD